MALAQKLRLPAGSAYAELTAISGTSSLAGSVWKNLQQAAADYLENIQPLVWPTGETAELPDDVAREYQDFILDKKSLLDGVAAVTGVRNLADKGLLAGNPELEDIIALDLQAILKRDPAAQSLINPFLNYKGFHAIAIHRVAHAYWKAAKKWEEEGRTDYAEKFRKNALRLQRENSRLHTVDIHPAVKIGIGFFLDHAHNIVIGETAQIGDDVTMLHAVTLGGTGKESGDRHPKVGSGVTIGAGAKILGNIFVGDKAIIAAGAAVTKDVPPGATMIGVPAHIERIAPPPSGVVNVINPIGDDRKGEAWVFTAPHYSDDKLEDAGLVDANGKLIEGVDPHETHDLHLPNIVIAFAKVAGKKVAIVHGLQSRLIFEGARIRDKDLAVPTTTPSGVPIPAYHGEQGRQNRLRAWRSYHEYRSTLEGQIALGARFVGSLDTFTPASLKGDIGGAREMAISIISTEENLELAKAIQAGLLRRLSGKIEEIQHGTGHTVKSERLVTINEPYGAQVAYRQLAFEKGKSGLIFEFRQDLAADPAKAAFFAKALWETLEEVYALKHEAHIAHQPARRRQAESHRSSAPAGLEAA